MRGRIQSAFVSRCTNSNVLICRGGVVRSNGNDRRHRVHGRRHCRHINNASGGGRVTGRIGRGIGNGVTADNGGINRTRGGHGGHATDRVQGGSTRINEGR